MDREAKNEILSAIGILGEKVDNMQQDINQMKIQVAKIPKMEKQIENMQNDILKLKEEAKSTNERLTFLEKEMKGTNERLTVFEKNTNERLTFLEEETKSISRSVTFIENDHGDKLKALFDAFTMTTEKAERQETKNNFFENKLEKHDAEIYYLNAKVQGL